MAGSASNMSEINSSHIAGLAGLDSDCAVAESLNGGRLRSLYSREGESGPVQALFREPEESCRTSSVEDEAGRFSAEGNNKIDINRGVFSEGWKVKGTLT